MECLTDIDAQILRSTFEKSDNVYKKPEFYMKDGTSSSYAEIGFEFEFNDKDHS